MGPTRTTKTRKSGESSSGAPKLKRHRGRQNNEPTLVQPGLQKLKASLRQTRRLLAKDNLAADVRVETERRLKALEADLAHGEVAKKERSLAIRYHKIKFFERQKVVRKLNQAKKRLALALKQEDAALIKEIQGSMTELQVDLNYILHYPKSKKYISLFPPEVRHPDTTSQNQRKQASESTAAGTDREEMRTWIRTRMQNGELAMPETHMDMDSRSKLSKKTSVQHGRDTYMGDGCSRDEVGRTKTGKGKESVDADAFFGDDDEDEDEDDEAEEEIERD